jgi:hypothetical protein
MIRTARLMVCLLLTANASCTAWRVVPPPWPGPLAAKPAEGYRVHLLDGRMVSLDSLRIAGDSLYGHHTRQRGDRVQVTRYSMPLTEIARIERGASRSTSIALGVVGGTLFGALAGASGCESDSWLEDMQPMCIAGVSLLGAVLGGFVGFALAY